MAVDFEAIRRKLAQISNQNKPKADAMWRPEPNIQYRVRIVPFPDNEGQPFKERWFYYGIGNNKGLLTPNQFGKKDPIQELISKLREEGSKESYELAKKLYPKMRTYAAVIIRGDEDKGVRLWAFGKNLHKDILTFILDEDYGDITDPLQGRDLKVTVTPAATSTDWSKTDVLPAPKVSRLSEDSAQAKAWLTSIPDINDIFKLKSYEELEGIITGWLDGTDSTPSDSQGTEKSGKQEEVVSAETTNKLDEVAASVKSESKSKKEKKDSKVHSDLDDAFADLVDNE